jgi:hypothetical protein
LAKQEKSESPTKKTRRIKGRNREQRFYFTKRLANVTYKLMLKKHSRIEDYALKASIKM